MWPMTHCIITVYGSIFAWKPVRVEHAKDKNLDPVVRPVLSYTLQSHFHEV